MKRILFFTACFFVLYSANSQSLTIANDDLVEYNTVDVRPEFTGDYPNFMDFVAKNFNLPDYEGPTGLLKVGFVIELNGVVSSVKVLKNLDVSASNEIKKVMAKCPQWKPGEHNGKPVRVYYEFALKLLSQS